MTRALRFCDMARGGVKRSTRVAEVIKEEISRMVLRDLKDPQLGFVTITRVRLSDDLRSARVYYSVLGGPERRNQTRDTLQRSLRFIRSEIGRRLSLRYVPELRFYYDDSVEYAEKIQSLINKLHSEEEGDVSS